jgi:hypothetical protein
LLLCNKTNHACLLCTHATHGACSDVPILSLYFFFKPKKCIVCVCACNLIVTEGDLRRGVLFQLRLCCTQNTYAQFSEAIRETYACTSIWDVHEDRYLKCHAMLMMHTGEGSHAHDHGVHVSEDAIRGSVHAFAIAQQEEVMVPGSGCDGGDVPVCALSIMRVGTWKALAASPSFHGFQSQVQSTRSCCLLSLSLSLSFSFSFCLSVCVSVCVCKCVCDLPYVAHATCTCMRTGAHTHTQTHALTQSVVVSTSFLLIRGTHIYAILCVYIRNCACVCVYLCMCMPSRALNAI